MPLITKIKNIILLFAFIASLLFLSCSIWIISCLLLLNNIYLNILFEKKKIICLKCWCDLFIIFFCWKLIVLSFNYLLLAFCSQSVWLHRKSVYQSNIFHSIEKHFYMLTANHIKNSLFMKKEKQQLFHIVFR